LFTELEVRQAGSVRSDSLFGASFAVGSLVVHSDNFRFERPGL